MLGCSFCEMPLACKACGREYEPKTAAEHQAIYQPDTTICCPECQKPLICKWCGYLYSPQDEEDEEVEVEE